MVNFYDCEKRLKESDLENLEKRIQFRLPITYKEHLLIYNGGRCNPNIFSFDENGKNTESMIDWFLAIYDGEDDNFESYFKEFKVKSKRLPDALFPFAHDPGGNLICMNAINEKIYFWDHEMEIDYSLNDDTINFNLFLLANDLNSFIANLY